MVSHRQLSHKSWLLVPGLAIVLFNICAADDAPTGPIGQDSGNAIAGTTVAGNASSGAISPEVKLHQDDRDAALTRMEQFLKSKNPTFLTAPERVALNSGKATPAAIDTSKLTTELAALVDAVNQIKAARTAVKANPNAPLDLNKIKTDFETVMGLLDQRNADELAAELLMIGLKTVEKTDLVKAQPGKLLPMLMKDFVSQLGVGDLFGVVPVAPATKQDAKFTPPPTQQQLLEKQLKESAAKFKLTAK